MLNRFLYFSTVIVLVSSTAAANAQKRSASEEMYQQGLEFVEKGQFIRAIAKLEQAVQLNPDWRYLEPLAQAYEAQNEVDKAYDTYDKLIKKAGNKLPAVKRNEIRKIMDVLRVRKNQQASQAEAKSRYQVGTRLQQEGRLELAIMEFEAAFDLSGEYFIKRNIAVIELALGNKARALSEFQKYLKLGQGKTTDRDRAAVEAQIRQIQADLKDEETLKGARDDIRKARTLIGRGDFEGAYKLLEKSYKIYQFYDALQYMGQASAEMKLYRRAIYFYNGFVAMGGNRIPPLTSQTVQSEIARIMPFAQEEERRDQAALMAEQGREYMKRKDFGAALLSFEQAYRFSPSYSYLKLIAEASEALHHEGKALMHYEKFLADGGSSISASERDVVRKRIAALRQSLASSNSEEVAAELFQQGMDAYNAKNYQMAVMHFEAAYNKSSNHSLLNWYAESEAGLGNYEKALALYQLYLDEGSGKIKPGTRARTEKRIGQLKQKIQSTIQIAEVPRDMESELSDLIALKPTDGSADDRSAQTALPAADYAASESPPKKRVWTWVTLGATIAFTGTAVTTGIVANYKWNEIESKCPDNLCPPEYILGATEWEKQANNLELVRSIFIGAGAGALAAFVVLAIVEPIYWAEKELAIAPAIGNGHAGLSLHYSF